MDACLTVIVILKHNIVREEKKLEETLGEREVVALDDGDDSARTHVHGNSIYSRVIYRVDEKLYSLYRMDGSRVASS